MILHTPCSRLTFIRERRLVASCYDEWRLKASWWPNTNSASCVSDWTVNSISGLWSPRALALLSDNCLVGNVSKGWRISMLKADQGPSPFWWLHLVARLSMRWISMLEADRGPSLTIGLIARLSNWWRISMLWSWLGALPFLTIAFGSKAIKEPENIDA